MLMTLFVLGGWLLVAALVGSVIAGITRALTGSDALAKALGGFAIPALLVASLIYWAITMEVDDPAPGNVIVGSLTALVVLTPPMAVGSILTVNFLARRARRKTREAEKPVSRAVEKR